MSEELNMGDPVEVDGYLFFPEAEGGYFAYHPESGEAIMDGDFESQYADHQAVIEKFKARQVGMAR